MSFDYASGLLVGFGAGAAGIYFEQHEFPLAIAAAAVALVGFAVGIFGEKLNA